MPTPTELARAFKAAIDRQDAAAGLARLREVASYCGFLEVSAAVQAYGDRLVAVPGVKRWIDDALAEQDFLDFEEPYRTSR